jgi:hypothetical protein
LLRERIDARLCAFRFGRVGVPADFEPGEGNVLARQRSACGVQPREYVDDCIVVDIAITVRRLILRQLNYDLWSISVKFWGCLDGACYL